MSCGLCSTSVRQGGTAWSLGPVKQAVYSTSLSLGSPALAATRLQCPGPLQSWLGPKASIGRVLPPPVLNCLWLLGGFFAKINWTFCTVTSCKVPGVFCKRSQRRLNCWMGWHVCKAVIPSLWLCFLPGAKSLTCQVTYLYATCPCQIMSGQ